VVDLRGLDEDDADRARAIAAASGERDSRFHDVDWFETTDWRLNAANCCCRLMLADDQKVGCLLQ
jgi:hypothetical protein